MQNFLNGLPTRILYFYHYLTKHDLLKHTLNVLAQGVAGNGEKTDLVRPNQRKRKQSADGETEKLRSIIMKTCTESTLCMLNEQQLSIMSQVNSIKSRLQDSAITTEFRNHLQDNEKILVEKLEKLKEKIEKTEANIENSNN